MKERKIFLQFCKVLNGSNDPHDLHATYRRKKKMAIRSFFAFVYQSNYHM